MSAKIVMFEMVKSHMVLKALSNFVYSLFGLIRTMIFIFYDLKFQV